VRCWEAWFDIINGLSHSNETIHLKYGYLFYGYLFFKHRYCLDSDFFLGNGKFGRIRRIWINGSICYFIQYIIAFYKFSESCVISVKIGCVPCIIKNCEVAEFGSLDLRAMDITPLV